MHGVPSSSIAGCLIGHLTGPGILRRGILCRGMHARESPQFSATCMHGRGKARNVRNTKSARLSETPRVRGEHRYDIKWRDDGKARSCSKRPGTCPTYVEFRTKMVKVKKPTRSRQMDMRNAALPPLPTVLLWLHFNRNTCRMHEASEASQLEQTSGSSQVIPRTSVNLVASATPSPCEVPVWMVFLIDGLWRPTSRVCM